MGLIEEDWIVSLGAVDPEEVVYHDFVAVGRRLTKELREEGARIVIAITHMRVHHDRQLAQEVPGIDLILGGHDHFFKCVAFRVPRGCVLVDHIPLPPCRCPRAHRAWVFPRLPWHFVRARIAVLSSLCLGAGSSRKVACGW